MHELLIYPALLWITGLLGWSTVLVLRARSVLERVAVLEMMTLLLIGVLALLSALRDRTFYLEVAVALALLSFIGVIAYQRYERRGSPFP
ncbi:MAG: monovalent cation/H+ antiporter complex subunit F [Solirubrobacterales bacterium]